LAKPIASLRSVLIRSPGLRGINEGATATHSCPASLNWRRMDFGSLAALAPVALIVKSGAAPAAAMSTLRGDGHEQAS
jgi:hypothetical protein